MNKIGTYELPAIGTAMDGGFFIGCIALPEGPHGLVKAPKTLGDFADMRWGPYADFPGALSFVDGRANTIAMAAADSELATRILDLNAGGKSDWYLPALDEIEIAYRNCKPGVAKNYMRSGINLHTIPPTHPYTACDPAQTSIEIFRKRGAECFEEEAIYWSSTQYAYDSDYAWCQYFGDGYHGSWRKGGKYRGCAVRRAPIR